MTSTRWLNRRQLECAEKNIVMCQEHLVKTGAQYSQGYDEIYYKFCEIVANLETIKESIKNLREII
jgi:hypothetical protein